jgi:hypothetical protein
VTSAVSPAAVAEGRSPAAMTEGRSPAAPWRAAALCSGLAVALAVVFLFNPATAAFYPPCPFRLLTGLLCPGCGATRAVHQLLHGRVGAALALNPLLPLYLAALGWVFLAQLRLALGRPPLAGPRLAAGWIWALLALVLAFWVVRNLH